jgi:hypothetical protein
LQARLAHMFDAKAREKSGLLFTDEGPWLRRITRFLDRILGMEQIELTARPKGLLRRFTLKDLGKSVGLADVTTQPLLKVHARRFAAYYSLSILITLLMYLLWGAIVLALLTATFAAVAATGTVIGAAVVASASTFVGLLLIFVGARTAIRLAVFLMDRVYADTVCVMQSISIVVELSRDDVLAHPGHRRSLLKRITHLARSTRFVALGFADTNSANQAWLADYFRRVELYIREREKWASVPVATTLNDLRHDFYQLAKIFTSSQYGDLPALSVTPESIPVSPSRSQRVGSLALRFLGVVLPILILGVLFLDPSRLAALGVQGTTLTLILIAWFLLAVDAVLRLGIVERLAGVAKALKDL